MSRLLVIGLGNRHRGDDAVGPLVIERLEARLGAAQEGAHREVRLLAGTLDPLSLLDAWEGCEHVVIVDAAVTGAPVGTVHGFDTAEALSAKATARCSSHGGGLADALALGAALGRQPARLTVLAVEAARFDAGARPSDPVRVALDEVVDRVLSVLQRDESPTPASVATPDMASTDPSFANPVHPDPTSPDPTAPDPRGTPCTKRP